jgi:hypothetical protein
VGPRKVNGNAMVAGPGAAVALSWAWDGLFPSYPMPAEVAVAFVPLLGYAIAYGLSWLRTPN